MVKTPTTHVRIPGFDIQLWLLTPAAVVADSGGAAKAQAILAFLLPGSDLAG